MSQNNASRDEKPEAETTTATPSEASGASSGDQAGLSRKQKKKQREREKKREKAAKKAADDAQSNGMSPATTTSTTLERGTTSERGASAASADVGALSEAMEKHSLSCGAAERIGDIDYVDYTSETQLPAIMSMVDRDLSEPYNIFTYRYFLHNWPNLCMCAVHEGETIGVIICKAEDERVANGDTCFVGYIAMLAVDSRFRKRGIGSALVKKSLHRMRELGCDEAMLETEVTNIKALRLYERLGFLRDERLLKYYLNGVDAYRLRLWFR